MKTPLFDEHVALGARMVDFAGWEMPVLYLPSGGQGGGIIKEHIYTREHASIFDTCHMGTFELSGQTAESDLGRLITQSVSSLKIGACSYGYLLADDGGVLDDLICFRRSNDCFWLVVNAGTKSDDAAWIKQHLSAGTSFTDCSSGMAKLDIQGPSSKEQMEQALDIELPNLKYFHFQEITVCGISCTLSRTGYTGEWGYELFLPADQVERIWKKCIEKSDIQPAGLGARDSLRMEMGYPLYGHELGKDRMPVGASGSRFIDMSGPFIGKEVIQRELENGEVRVLVGLLLEGRKSARPHDKVINNNAIAGEVTSGLFSPSLNKAAALAYVDKELSQPGQELEVEVRGKALPVKVEELPFYKKGSVVRGQ